MRAADCIYKLYHAAERGGFIGPGSIFIALITVFFRFCISRDGIRQRGFRICQVFKRGFIGTQSVQCGLVLVLAVGEISLNFLLRRAVLGHGNAGKDILVQKTLSVLAKLGSVIPAGSWLPDV